MYAARVRLLKKFKRLVLPFVRGKQPEEIKLLNHLMSQTSSIPRFTPGEVSILGYPWIYLDYLAFAWEYQYIFIDEDYYFACHTSQPRIIDAGGHVGLATLYFKRLFPFAQVHVFEPLPDAIDALTKNIERNNLTGVIIHPYALWTNDDGIEFRLDEPDAGSIAKTRQNRPGTCVQVKTCRLYDYIDIPTHFLKMNIEGAECDVIVDCQERLRNIEQMVISYHSFEGQPQKLQNILAALSDSGFRYLIQHFHTLNPPFKLTKKTRFFLWIYAIRDDLIGIS